VRRLKIAFFPHVSRFASDRLSSSSTLPNKPHAVAHKRRVAVPGAIPSKLHPSPPPLCSGAAPLGGEQGVLVLVAGVASMVWALGQLAAQVLDLASNGPRRTRREP
jgi:hypothetical protein